MRALQIFNDKKNFNSQPHKEADVSGLGTVAKILNFNSQPHKEADEEFGSGAKNTGNFNSQPHKEADRQQGSTSNHPVIFQLTASQGG